MSVNIHTDTHSQVLKGRGWGNKEREERGGRGEELSERIWKM